MKLPFTWDSLSAADKKWLENVPASAVWDFVATLPKLERLPFDDPYYAPSGADFMSKHGKRLREYVASWEPKIDEELVERLNKAAEKCNEEEMRRFGEADDRLLQKHISGELDFEAYMAEAKALNAAYIEAHREELAPFAEIIQENRQRYEQELAPYAPNGQLTSADDYTIALIRRTLAQTHAVAQEQHAEAQEQSKQTDNARGNQRGAQRREGKLMAQVEDLKAEVAKLTQERDAARAALLGIDPAEAHS